MLLNPYQDELAERSLIIEATGNGEYWNFRWYIDPITNGLSKWYQVSVHVYPDGGLVFDGLPFPRDEEEMRAQDEALEFVKRRFKKVGLDEENTKGWD